jgi:hypothetical protein
MATVILSDFPVFHFAFCGWLGHFSGERAA